MKSNLDVFIEPQSVAVIGATERPGSWGSLIMENLLAWHFPGKLYPVNPRYTAVYGLPAYRDMISIPGPVDLAVFTIPEDSVEEAIRGCGAKGVKGISLITAGFGETGEEGRLRQEAMAKIARSLGMRVLGPNVSGTFNIHAGFNASAVPPHYVLATSLAVVCQGGYAIREMLARGYAQGMGVGKYIHTGNECDLQVTDFLEHFGEDPQVSGILMYLETLRDGRRFLEVARRVASHKPIIIHKAGRTTGGTRAARSHTGAVAGLKEIYQTASAQANIISSPSIESLLPLGHALIERPPMRGNRVAIITLGGSFGVMLSDALEEEGLIVPELSRATQAVLRSLGLPPRASTRNPVDIGAAGMDFPHEAIVAIGRIVLSSNEVDALILHGLGQAGFIQEDTSPGLKLFIEQEKRIMRDYDALEREIGKPVILGSVLSRWESQTVSDLQSEGIRILHRLDEIAQILYGLYDYGRKRQRRKSVEISPLRS